LLPHAALLAVITLATQPAGNASLDLPSYIGDLERAARAVRVAATADEAARSIPEGWTVTIDGATISVDARPIHGKLEAANSTSWPSVRVRVANRLDAMRLEAAASRAELQSDPRVVLAETLARKEFQRAQASNWLERLRERISDWLMRLFSRIFGASLGSRTVAVVFAWIASGVALIVLAMWLASLLTRRPRATVLDLDTPAKRAAARDWALRALAPARIGDLREAVRCGYHAAVRRLEEQGTWTVDDARTPREYMRLLHGDDPRNPMLGDLTRRFEQVWYGNRPATGDDARQVAAHLERLGCLHPGEQAS
jgi:hypothetical protein